jgi:hypothetical protein
MVHSSLWNIEGFLKGLLQNNAWLRPTDYATMNYLLDTKELIIQLY